MTEALIDAGIHYELGVAPTSQSDPDNASRSCLPRATRKTQLILASSADGSHPHARNPPESVILLSSGLWHSP